MVFLAAGDIIPTALDAPPTGTTHHTGQRSRRTGQRKIRLSDRDLRAVDSVVKDAQLARMGINWSTVPGVLDDAGWQEWNRLAGVPGSPIPHLNREDADNPFAG